MELGRYPDGREVAYDEDGKRYTVGGELSSVEQLGADAETIAWDRPDLADWFKGQPPAAAPPAKAKAKVRPIVVLAVVGGLLLACVACAVIGSLAQSTAPPVAAVKSPAAQSSQPPETQPEAAAPAPEPEPAPATAKETVAETFGEFNGVTKKGRGASVMALPTGPSAVLVIASHSGSSNFSIESLDASNQMADLLVNTIGKYAGTTFCETDSAKKLKITADGSWKITIMPVSRATVMSATTSGKGDAVLLYDGAAADWAVTHKGQSNFAIKVTGTEGSDLLVNEIGNYSGTVPVSGGPMVVIITADGRWSVISK